MRTEFTAKAKATWDAIPARHRKALLTSVWCVRCSSATTMVDPVGQLQMGDLLLTGKCKRCGGAVSRLVECQK